MSAGGVDEVMRHIASRYMAVRRGSGREAVERARAFEAIIATLVRRARVGRCDDATDPSLRAQPAPAPPGASAVAAASPLRQHRADRP